MNKLNVKYGKLSLNAKEHEIVHGHFLRIRNGKGLGFQQFFKDWTAKEVLNLIEILSKTRSNKNA